MSAVQAKSDAYRAQNVQVLGISTDSTENLAAFGKKLGIKFSLLSDTNGKISTQLGVFDRKNQLSARAFVVINDSEIVFSRTVRTTGIPAPIRPWVDSLKA